MADPHRAHGSQASGHAVAHPGGPSPVRTYWVVAGVLAIITAIELAALYVPGLPNAVLVTGLILLSAAKFVLVVGIYMHLQYDSPVFKVMFVGPLLISIAIILALMALFSAFLLLPR